MKTEEKLYNVTGTVGKLIPIYWHYHRLPRKKKKLFKKSGLVYKEGWYWGYRNDT